MNACDIRLAIFPLESWESWPPQISQECILAQYSSTFLSDLEFGILTFPRRLHQETSPVFRQWALNRGGIFLCWSFSFVCFFIVFVHLGVGILTSGTLFFFGPRSVIKKTCLVGRMPLLTTFWRQSVPSCMLFYPWLLM